MNDEAVQCPKCGAEMFVGAHFCMRCGAQLTVEMLDADLELSALAEPVESEQSSTKLRTAERSALSLAATLPLPNPPALKPPERGRPSSLSKVTAPLPIPTRLDPRARTAEKAPHTQRLPLAPLAFGTDFAPSPVPQGTPEPGSGPRASSRPSAVPFMEPPSATASSEAASAAPDGAALTPGTMTEALVRVSRLPDFSIDDIDNGFDSIQNTASQRPHTGAPDSLAGSYAEVQSLFADMVAAHMAPIRELLLKLEAGDTHHESLDLCRPVARALKSAAEQLPDEQLHRALCALSGALEAASANGRARIEDPARTELRDAYRAVSRLLPTVSELDPERARREPIIVQAIFECTAGLGRIQRDKLAAAGFTGLSMLCLARASELSEASGVPLELAERLVNEVERFKRAAALSALDANRDGNRQALTRLTATLRQQNDAFESSRRGWSREDQEAKRRAQRNREETLAQLNIALAELGELPLIAKLEKLPFERKLSELERFLIPTHSDKPRFSHASGGE